MPNGDDKAFAEAIDTLLGNAALRREYAENGMKRVRENFTIPAMTSTMEKYYECLVS